MATPSPEVTAALIAAVASAAAAVFAGIQIGVSAGAQKRATTFDHLRDIDLRLQSVWLLDLNAVEDELRRAYTSGAHALSEQAGKYMALLNSLELLALAVESSAVDAHTANDYLRTLCRAGTIKADVIDAIRTGSKDERIYRCLGNKLKEFAPPTGRKQT